MIATALHLLAEMTGDDPIVDAMLDAPKYAIAPSLFEVLAREDIQKSVLAMIEAGIARLPFSPLMVEFSASSTVRRFVLLEESGEGFSARTAMLLRDRMASLSPSLARVTVSPRGLHVERFSDEAEGMAIGLAGAIALLMLNIKGVEKEIVETATLNKVREKRGRPPIPRHTVLRIGTVFDRTGRAQGLPGRVMPVHLRAGHVRMQACGEGFADRRAVFIPPVLVNYRDATGERPRLPEKVVML